LSGNAGALDEDAQLSTAASLEILNFERVLSTGKCPFAAHLDRAMKSVVVDELFAVDEKLTPVIREQ
jgi:hypothetical protein